MRRGIIDRRVVLQEQALREIRNTGAFVDSTHVVLASGLHSDTYVNKAMLFARPRIGSALGKLLATLLPRQITQVIGCPAVGAISLTNWVGYHMMTLDHAPVVVTFADKIGERKFQFGRGFDMLMRGREVLIIEDIVTTGGSLKAAITAARAVGARVTCAAVLWNRGDVTAEQLGVTTLYSLISMSLQAWPVENCQLCRGGVPLNTTLSKGIQQVPK
ncbi:MAG: phosphoribosyltransferase family protein [Patescibacteria group bacterium]